MKLENKLNSFHLIERESNLNLIKWTYPTIEDYLRELIISKCFFTFKDEVCYCIRAKNIWIYIYQWLYKEKTSEAFVLITEEFDPKKYKAICNVMVRMYKKTGNPVDLVKLYLNLFISGSCTFQENGAIVSFNLNNFKSETNLKELIMSMGAEIIFLYNAILLKRQIIVYHEDIEKLQLELFALTKLVTMRNKHEYLLPFVDDVKQVKGLPFYVAGTTNKRLIENNNLYDIFINLVTFEVTLSTKGREALPLTKMHKELARLMLDYCKNDRNEEDLVTEIFSRTQELLKRLDSIATTSTENRTKTITMDDLRNRNLNPTTENFLFHLAVAENMMML